VVHLARFAAWACSSYSGYHDNSLVYCSGTRAHCGGGEGKLDHGRDGHSEKAAAASYMGQWIIGPDARTIAQPPS